MSEERKITQIDYLKAVQVLNDLEFGAVRPILKRMSEIHKEVYPDSVKHFGYDYHSLDHEDHFVVCGEEDRCGGWDGLSFPSYYLWSDNWEVTYRAKLLNEKAEREEKEQKEKEEALKKKEEKERKLLKQLKEKYDE